MGAENQTHVSWKSNSVLTAEPSLQPHQNTIIILVFSFPQNMDAVLCSSFLGTTIMFFNFIIIKTLESKKKKKGATDCGQELGDNFLRLRPETQASTEKQPNANMGLAGPYCIYSIHLLSKQYASNLFYTYLLGF